MLLSAAEAGHVVLLARAAATLFASRRLSVWAHELSHLFSALALGYECSEVELDSWRPSVTVLGRPSRAHAAWIHHAGWVASVMLAALLALLAWGVRDDAMLAPGDLSSPPAVLASDGELGVLAAIVALACIWTAGEAVQSDLLSSHRLPGTFFCGNFGLLLLQQASAVKVDAFLRKQNKMAMIYWEKKVKHYNVTFKSHLFWHMARQARFFNPRHGWTYRDESFVGAVAKVLRCMFAAANASHGAACGGMHALLACEGTA